MTSTVGRRCRARSQRPQRSRPTAQARSPPAPPRPLTRAQGSRRQGSSRQGCSRRISRRMGRARVRRRACTPARPQQPMAGSRAPGSRPRARRAPPRRQPRSTPASRLPRSAPRWAAAGDQCPDYLIVLPARPCCVCHTGRSGHGALRFRHFAFLLEIDERCCEYAT